MTDDMQADDPAWALTDEQLRSLAEARGYLLCKWEPIETSPKPTMHHSRYGLEPPQFVISYEGWDHTGNAKQRNFSRAYWIGPLDHPRELRIFSSDLAIKSEALKYPFGDSFNSPVATHWLSGLREPLPKPPEQKP